MMEEILRVVEEQADTIIQKETTICRLVRLLIEQGMKKEEIEDAIQGPDPEEPEPEAEVFFGERSK